MSTNLLTTSVCAITTRDMAPRLEAQSFPIPSARSCARPARRQGPSAGGAGAGPERTQLREILVHLLGRDVFPERAAQYCQQGACHLLEHVRIDLLAVSNCLDPAQQLGSLRALRVRGARRPKKGACTRTAAGCVKNRYVVRATAAKASRSTLFRYATLLYSDSSGAPSEK